MEEAGIVIRLVDGSPEEQAAFNQPPPNFNQDSGTPAPPPSSTESVSTASPTASQSPAEGAANPSASPSADLLASLRDAMLTLADRFAPEAFRIPIERLINALAPRDADGNTTVPPPVQEPGSADQTRVIPPVQQVNPTPRPEEKKPEDQPTTSGFRNALRFVRDQGSRLLGRTRTGRAVQGAFQRGSQFAQRAVRAAGRTRTGRAAIGVARRAGGAIASRLGMGAASGAAVAGGSSAAGAGGAAASAGAAGAGIALAPVVATVGAVVAAFAAVALAAKALTDTFTAEADRLENYSASISLARARAQVNTELNLLERANRVGGALGSFENARASLSNQTEKLWTDILQILSRLEPIVSTGIDAISLIVAEVRKGVLTIEQGAAAVDLAIASFTADPADDKKAQDRVNAIADEREEIVRMQTELMARVLGLDNSKDGPEMDPMLKAILDMEIDEDGAPNLKRRKQGDN